MRSADGTPAAPPAGWPPPHAPVLDAATPWLLPPSLGHPVGSDGIRGGGGSSDGGAPDASDGGAARAAWAVGALPPPDVARVGTVATLVSATTNCGALRFLATTPGAAAWLLRRSPSAALGLTAAGLREATAMSTQSAVGGLPDAPAPAEGEAGGGDSHLKHAGMLPPGFLQTININMLLAPFASVNGVTFGYVLTDLRYHRDVLGHGCHPPSSSYRFVSDEEGGQLVIVAPNPNGTLFVVWLCVVDPPAGAVGMAARRRRRRCMVVLSPPPDDGVMPVWVLHRTDVEEEVVSSEESVRPGGTRPAPSAAAVRDDCGGGSGDDGDAAMDDLYGLPARPPAPAETDPEPSLVIGESRAGRSACLPPGTPAMSLPDDIMTFLKPLDEETADGLVACAPPHPPVPQEWPPSSLSAASPSESSSSVHLRPPAPTETTVAAVAAHRVSTSPVDFSGFMDSTLRLFSGLAVGSVQTTCIRRQPFSPTAAATLTPLVGQSRTWLDPLPAGEVAALKVRLIQSALDAMAGWVPRPVGRAVVPLEQLWWPPPGGRAPHPTPGFGAAAALGTATCHLAATPSASSIPRPPVALPLAAARGAGVGGGSVVRGGGRCRAPRADVVDVNSKAYWRQMRNRLAARRSNEQRRLRRLAARTAAAVAAAAEVAVAAAGNGSVSAGGDAPPPDASATAVVAAATAAVEAVAAATASGAVTPGGSGATGDSGDGAAAVARPGGASNVREGRSACAAAAVETTAAGHGEGDASG